MLARRHSYSTRGCVVISATYNGGAMNTLYRSNGGMRRALTARLLIGAGLVAAAGSASAEGSVTLYGIVDDAMTYVTNEGGKHAWAQNSGVGQSNRWGLRGIEALGGGWRARALTRHHAYCSRPAGQRTDA